MAHILDEVYYKDLLHKIVGGPLPHRDYSALIKSVHWMGVDGDIMRLFVPNRYNGWVVSLQFAEWEQEVHDAEYNAMEAARLLLWGGNVRVHCQCPAFLYWGYQYIATQKGFSIVPEDRMPVVRNPHLLGFTCKHIRRSLMVMPFHNADIASAIKKERELKGLPNPTKVSAKKPKKQFDLL